MLAANEKPETKQTAKTTETENTPELLQFRAEITETEITSQLLQMMTDLLDKVDALEWRARMRKNALEALYDKMDRMEYDLHDKMDQMMDDLDFLCDTRSETNSEGDSDEAGEPTKEPSCSSHSNDDEPKGPFLV